MAYEDFKTVIRLGGGLAPSGSGTFPVARACDILMPDNSRLDKYLENFDGGNSDSDVPNYNPPTVWEINEIPDLEGIPTNSTSQFQISFTSNGTDYVGMYRDRISGGFYYTTPTAHVVYSTSNGWSDEAYRTITIHEEITDENLLAWLQTNATLISSGKSDDSDTSLEMPIIKFVNAIFSHATAPEEGSPQGYVSEEYPLKFTVEVIGGTLQAGDELQVCVRRTYRTVEYDSTGSKFHRRKQKLRRFAWRTISEGNLDDRFLSVTLFRDDCKNVGSCLFHNDRTGFDRQSALYLRIRRPVGELQDNESGMTVDAKFSNVVTVWKSYALDGKLTIK